MLPRRPTDIAPIASLRSSEFWASPRVYCYSLSTWWPEVQPSNIQRTLGWHSVLFYRRKNAVVFAGTWSELFIGYRKPQHPSWPGILCYWAAKIAFSRTLFGEPITSLFAQSLLSQPLLLSSYDILCEKLVATSGSSTSMAKESPLCLCGPRKPEIPKRLPSSLLQFLLPSNPLAQVELYVAHNQRGN